VRVVALLGSYSGIPVVTWAPVHRDVIGENSQDGVISTFGTYDDFASAAIVVMRHLKWTKT
ncbi:guanylate cyclase, partial [Biomphalaria glabrata]